MSQAIRFFFFFFFFFFSQRQITTAQGGQSIITDFDGGFDSITILPAGTTYGSESNFETKPGSASGSGSESGSGSASASASLIQAHIRSIETHSQALTQASAVAGTIISIARKVMTGPCGWIRLGMEVIRSFAGSNDAIYAQI